MLRNGTDPYCRISLRCDATCSTQHDRLIATEIATAAAVMEIAMAVMAMAVMAMAVMAMAMAIKVYHQNDDEDGEVLSILFHSRINYLI